MELREAKFEDWENLLDWRNDPTTRENSFTTSVLSKESHIEWFVKSLNSLTRSIFILENEDSIPVGTIRSDVSQDNTFLLSWSISPKHRGKGYGNLILSLFLQNRKGIFIAEIKPTNIPSIKMVEKNGFKKMNNHQYKKHQ